MEPTGRRMCRCYDDTTTTSSSTSSGGGSKKFVPGWVQRPYSVWRDNFQQDRCCSRKHIRREFLTAALPVFLLNVAFFSYLVFGGFLFQEIDELTGSKSLNQLILFCFTTISTIGYGDIYPQSFHGKLACMLYCVIGIPLLLTTIATNSLILVDIYNIIHKSFQSDAKMVKDLPWFISLLLLIVHCLIGGVIFSCWIDSMDFVSAVYFSFTSIATIGFGDFTPTPEDWFQHAVIITFLGTGIGILTTFVGALKRTIMWMHTYGRTELTNSGDAEIWFNGNMMTVRELVTLVAEHFECTPERLRDVLHDLDKILELACNQTNEQQKCLIDAEDHQRNQSDNENQLTIRSNQRTLDKDTKMAVEALGVIKYHATKPTSARRKSKTPAPLPDMFRSS